MYYEFYLDVYFLENLMMNYFILRMTGRITARSISRCRTTAAAALGAVWACVMVILPIHRFIFLSIVMSFLSGIAMVCAGFGLHGRYTVMRTVTVFYLLVLLLGGIWQLLERYFPVRFPVSMLAGYGIVRAGYRFWYRIKNRVQFLYEVTITAGGRTVSMKGLLDSGNQLIMPGTGKPVQVVEFEAVRTLLSREETEELECMMKLETVEKPTGRFTYIPYHSIGREQGILPVMILDSVRIKHGENMWDTKGVAAAISKTAVSCRGEYQMILHPQIIE